MNAARKWGEWNFFSHDPLLSCPSKGSLLRAALIAAFIPFTPHPCAQLPTAPDPHTHSSAPAYLEQWICENVCVGNVSRDGIVFFFLSELQFLSVNLNN